MKELFAAFGMNYTGDVYDKLITFSEILEFYNARLNLTSIKNGRDTVIKHFYDSLKGEKYFDKNAVCAEVGSGGGFPSVPIMIARKDLSFTLIESVRKKCEYLEIVKKELGLNCEIICERAEVLGRDGLFREKYDCVTARAVAKLNVLSEYTLPLVKKFGKFIAYKAEADEEIFQAKNAINLLGGRIKEVEVYFLPENEGKRTLIVVEKTGETPGLYPRGNGKERKKPL